MRILLSIAFALCSICAFGQTQDIRRSGSAGGGSGSVTSVEMTGDGELLESTVSGSPITGTGTLAPSLKSQSANKVLAGPTTGSAAAPTFRSLVVGDIPTITSGSVILKGNGSGGFTNATAADLTNLWGIFTGDTTKAVSGAGTLVALPTDTTANWSASGTTNSTLAGSASVNSLVSTTSVTAATAQFNTSLSLTNDVILVRDAANTLALRNGTNPQVFRVYNTYTDASNYERFETLWSGNDCYLRTASVGTGTARALVVRAAAGAANGLSLDGDTVQIRTAAAALRWQVNTSGHFVAGTDNTYDIGASGANRPKNIFVGTSIEAQGAVSEIKSGLNVYCGATAVTGKLGHWSRGYLTFPADGVWTLNNNNANDFSRLQFGGTTASFPALRRNGTGLDVRLADDSNYGALNAPNQQSGYVHVCTSATTNALFYVSVPNTNTIGGRVLYTVSSTDGTDAQQITGTCQFGAVGKATVVTANVTDIQNTSTVSAGTLTAVLTANASTNNVFALMINPTTSLTTTNLVVKWRLETPSTYTVNPL